MKRVKIGIAGGAGYTGGELLRILLRHPLSDLVFVHSKSHGGKYLHEVHADLLGETELRFSERISEDIEVLLLCLGRGDSTRFLAEQQLSPAVRLIDLSQDFRLAFPASTPFVYGLPELNRSAIREAVNIANPGCFATAIQLALLPLATGNLIRNDIHISAITGSTGAGQALTPTSHFSWRNNNISVYKAFTHQHVHEIKKTLTALNPEIDPAIHFIPYRGNFTRGILASVYLQSTLSLTEAQSIYQQYYQSHPFVRISPVNIDLKQVINTNNCFLQLEKHGDMLLIISAIDNLIKGASGQAVQNMNLMFGLEETAGLRLKPAVF